MTPDELRLEFFLPGLRGSGYAITSPPTDEYNCIAWAAGIDHDWWEPLRRRSFWPPGAPRETTVAATMAALATVGYEPCSDGDPQDGVEKIAIYANGERFEHVARSLDSGRWTSKLGESYDIEHELEALTSTANRGGPVQYGEVVAYMRRALGG